MKRKSVALFTLIAFVVTMSILVFSACDGATKEEKGAKLLFFDDFDTLNTEVWNVYTAKTETDEGWGPEDGIRRGGFWDKKQVFTEDGNLVIRTEIRDGVAYTGAIDSDNKLEMHYGYYEVRCKVPQAPGIWSAFWIFCDEMGAHSKDPDISGTEIDIFESPFYGAKEPAFQSAIHIGDYVTSNALAMGGPNYLKKENISSGASDIYDGEYHLFGLDWQESYYRFYVDGILHYEITTADVKISNKDSFLFLSCEIGGSDGKIGETPWAVSVALLGGSEYRFAEKYSPVDFLVDYVKVYDVMPV